VKQELKAFITSSRVIDMCIQADKDTYEVKEVKGNEE